MGGGRINGTKWLRNGGLRVEQPWDSWPEITRHVQPLHHQIQNAYSTSTSDSMIKAIIHVRMYNDARAATKKFILIQTRQKYDSLHAPEKINSSKVRLTLHS